MTSFSAHSTARIATETASVYEPNRFRNFTDAIPQIAWTAKPTGEVDYYNARWHSYTGLTLEETRDWGWRGLIHPDDEERAASAWAKALAGNGSPCDVEYRIRGASGGYRWFLLRATPIYDGDGRLIRWVGTATDIEDRRATENEREILLREKQRIVAEYEGIVSAMTEGLLVASVADRTILALNPAFLAIHGYGSENGHSAYGGVDDPRGIPLAKFYESLEIFESDEPGARPLPQTEWPLARVLGGEAFRGYEVFVRNKATGRAWWGSYGGATVRGDNGEPRLALVTVRDVTERRRAQAERDLLLARQSRIAETLQRSLLISPEPAAFITLEVETLYESAGDDTLIGGDWFEAFALGGRQVCLVVGDNTGKGLQSALSTAELKFSLKAFAREMARESDGRSLIDPALLLSRLNSLVVEGIEMDSKPRDAFVCATVAVIDTVTDNGLVASAGMEPPLIVRAATETAEEIPACGAILGVLPEWRETPEQVKLAEGDVLWLFSDGLTEARHHRTRDFFGYDGLAETAAATVRQGGPLGAMAPGVLARVKEFTGGAVDDDVCVLLARRRVSGA